jgi:hypothetical protein
MGVGLGLAVATIVALLAYAVVALISANVNVTPIKPAELRLSSSCNATPPYTNASVLIIRVPENNSCSFEWPNVARALGYTPFHNVTTVQFDGTFSGTTGAPSNDFVDQLVISMENNASSEFGIYAGLQSGILFGYLEDNATQSYPTIVLLKPNASDGNFLYSGHFKISLAYINGTNRVYFYLNGKEIGELSYNSTKDYKNLGYYPYIAGQRWSNGWNSSQDQMEISNLTITTT